MGKKHDNFRMWKSGKKWLFACATVFVVGGAGAISAQLGVNPFTAIVAFADTVYKNGTQAGQTGLGTPLIQADSNDMQSDSFVGLLGSITKGHSYSGYVNLYWNSETQVLNATNLGSIMPKSSMGLYADGFNENSIATKFNINDMIKITNVGEYYKKGSKTPSKVNMGIIPKNVVRTDGVRDDQEPNDYFVAIKGNQDGPIMLGWGLQSPFGGGNGYDEGTGGSSGGAATINQGWIGQIDYQVVLYDESGKQLPSDTLNVMMGADVDAWQRATLDRNALAFITSKNSPLWINGDGLLSPSMVAPDDQNSTLDANSYVAVFVNNIANISYAYAGGASDPANGKHRDIVTGIFGKMRMVPEPPTAPPITVPAVPTVPTPPKEVAIPEKPTYGIDKEVTDADGNDLNNGSTLTDVEWDFKVNNKINGKDNTWSRFQQYLSDVAAYNAAYASYETQYKNYTDKVAEYNAQVKKNTDAWAQYEKEYQEYLDLGGSEPKQAKPDAKYFTNIKAEAKKAKINYDTTAEHFVFTKYAIIDELQNDKLKLFDKSKIRILDENGNAISSSNYSVDVKTTSTGGDDNEGTSTVTATFTDGYLKSDAFYTNGNDGKGYTLVIPTLTNIDDQAQGIDTKDTPNTAHVDITGPDEDKDTNRVIVKPIYTEADIHKNVLAYNEAKSFDDLFKSQDWKELEQLDAHDQLYAYKVDYQLGNHAQFASIKLSDPWFADIQVAPDDIAVYATVTGSKGVEKDNILLTKDTDYTVKYADDASKQTDGTMANVTGFSIDLKHVSDYARKTVKFTVILKDVTIKGANAQEEFNYLNNDDAAGSYDQGTKGPNGSQHETVNDDLMHIYNSAQLDWTDTTPDDSNKDKGQKERISNTTEVIPPQLDPKIQKYVEMDETKDELPNIVDNGDETTAEDNANQADKAAQLADATAALQVKLDELADVEFEKDSDYDLHYNAIIADIQSNQDEKGGWLLNVDAAQVNGWLDQLNGLDQYSKEKADTGTEAPVVKGLKTAFYLMGVSASNNEATIRVLVVVPKGHKDELLPILKDKQDEIRKMTNDPSKTKVETYAIENDGVEDYSLGQFKSALNSFLEAPLDVTVGKIPDAIKGLQAELWLSDGEETPTTPPSQGGEGSETNPSTPGENDGYKDVSDALDAYNKLNSNFTDFYNAHAKGSTEQVNHLREIKATKRAIETDMDKFIGDDGYLKDDVTVKDIAGLITRMEKVFQDLKDYVAKEGM